MRLQCPNCDAEYEVDPSAIPLDGRDVQCSNCGHGWFQAHPDYETDYDLESALYDPPPPLPHGDAVAGAVPKRELDPESQRILREEVAREQAMRAAEAARSAPPPPVAEPPIAPQPEAQDFDIEAALDAQRQDQEMEDHARRQPQNSSEIEAAPDANRDAADWELALSADDPATPSAPQPQPLPQTEAAGARVSPRRVARLKGLNAVAKTEAGPMISTRAMVASEPAAMPPSGAAPRDWLAEASTIQPDERPDVRPDVRPDLAAPEGGRTIGRRAGAYTSVLLALAGTAGYVMAPDLAQSVPQLAPALESYTQSINMLRDQLQAGVPRAIAWVQSWL